jgi:hypothetical protein
MDLPRTDQCVFLSSNYKYRTRTLVRTVRISDDADDTNDWSVEKNNQPTNAIQSNFSKFKNTFSKVTAGFLL